MSARLIDSLEVFVLDFQTQVGTLFRTRAKQKKKIEKDKKN